MQQHAEKVVYSEGLSDGDLDRRDAAVCLNLMAPVEYDLRSPPESWDDLLDGLLSDDLYDLWDAEELLADILLDAEESPREQPSDSLPHCCERVSSMTTAARAKHTAWSSKKKRRVKYGRKFVYDKKAAVARSRPRANKKFAKRTTGRPISLE
jgi:hypothetical protein